MIKLKIIHASTREGRKGLPVSHWVVKEAKKIPEFDVEFIDLKKLNLPFIDEPNHPKLQQYTKQHTKDWSKKVDEADAFIFVTTEYNYCMPATLSNAFDFLFHEWSYKPVALVGYGGISGGMRGMQQLKLLCLTPKAFPFEGVQIPFFANQIDENEIFQPNQSNSNLLKATFDELIRLGEGMKALRVSKH